MATTERTAETTTDEKITVKGREILIHTRGMLPRGHYSIHDPVSKAVLSHGRVNRTGLIPDAEGAAPGEALEAVRAAFGLPSAAEVAKTEKAAAKTAAAEAKHDAKRA